MGVSELSELKALKEGNCRFKHMYADWLLITDLQKKSSKKAACRTALKPVKKRLIAFGISQEAGFSIERACRVLQLSRSVFYYKTVKDDVPIITSLNELAEEQPTAAADRRGVTGIIVI